MDSFTYNAVKQRKDRRQMKELYFLPFVRNKSVDTAEVSQEICFSLLMPIKAFAVGPLLGFEET